MFSSLQIPFTLLIFLCIFNFYKILRRYILQGQKLWRFWWSIFSRNQQTIEASWIKSVRSVCSIYQWQNTKESHGRRLADASFEEKQNTPDTPPLYITTAASSPFSCRPLIRWVSLLWRIVANRAPAMWPGPASSTCWICWRTARDWWSILQLTNGQQIS